MHIGYARVSTEEQDTRLQLDALTDAGCARIFQEAVSGSNRERPELAKFLDVLRSGDTMTVWRLDYLPSAVANRHLLGVRTGQPVARLHMLGLA